MSETPEVRFWDCQIDNEQLFYSEVEEAVQAWVDDQDALAPLPEMVVVHGFAPKSLPGAEWIAQCVLYEITEHLDEEYGNQLDGERTEIPPELRAAALAFAEAVRTHYPVWSCEKVAERVVRVADYITEEAADA